MGNKKTFYRGFCVLLSFLLVITSFTPSFTIDYVMAKELKEPQKGEKTNNKENKKEAILKKDIKEMTELGITEVPSLRDEVSKVFIDEEGSYFAEVYLEPIHYEQNGEWKEIENKLMTSKDGQFIENQQNSFSVKFPKNKNGEKKNELLNYKIKKHDVTLNLLKEKSENSILEEVSISSPALEDGVVVYDNIFKDIKFEYAVEGSTVKENIQLDSYQGMNTFYFELDVNDLKAIEQDDGSIHFVDDKNEFVFLIERPYMFDSNHNVGEEGVISHEITQDIQKTETGYLLTLTASEDYLTDPARVYPVTIDPWIDVFQAEDTFVASNTSYNYHNTDYLFVGNHSTIGKTRSLLKFNLPNIPNGKVTGATLGLYQSVTSNTTPINLHELTSTFSSKSVTWASQPKFNTSISASNNSASIGYSNFDVTSLVKQWYEKPESNYGMMLKYPDANEATVNRKSFYSTELLTEDGDLFGKPKLVVEFRPIELLGVADYWTYTPDIFQGEGTGVVNVINGNLVYDISLINVSSKVEAFNLDLTYNSRSNYNTHYGMGWMFSPHESLAINTDQSILEYRASGGVRYHFTKQQYDNDVTYSSPEGIEYTLTKSANGFELKDTSETIRFFDLRGRLYEIKDEKGNRILYTFENETSNRVIKIVEKTGVNGTERALSLQYNTDGHLWRITDFKGSVTELQYEQLNAINHLKSITYAKGSVKNEKTITFAYSNAVPARLAAVTDANGNTGEVKYNASNQVIKMVDPRDTNLAVSLDYQSGYTIYTDSRNNKSKYEYSPLDNATVNVTAIIENYGSSDATTTKFEWDQNLLKKEYEPNKDTGLAEKVTTSVEYDEKGNMTSGNTTGGESITQTLDAKNNVTSYTESSGVYEQNIYDEKSNLVSSTSNFSLTDYNRYDQFGNISRSVSTTRGNYNRLTNAQFESKDATSFASDWRRYTSTNSGIYEQSAKSHSGNFSGKIMLSGAANAGYYTQTFAVTSAEKQKIYTVAAQVKTENVTGEGARIRVYPLDANNANLRNSKGETISLLTEPLSGTVDWTRISETFTLPAETVNVRVDLLFKGAGTAYFDDAQVTYGTTLNQFSANDNTSFEFGSSTTATDWTLNALGTGDGRNTTVKYTGEYSMRLTGTASSTRYAGQNVAVKGSKGSRITLSGWGYTTSAATTGNFNLSLLLTNANGVSKVYDIPFMKGTHIINTWQYAKDTVVAEEDFVSAKVYVKYGNQAGTAYFDNIKVEANGSAVAKSYSADGNNLLSETDALGNITNYTYDANGNELKVTDPTGLTKSRVYNDLGLVESVTIGKDANTITSSYSFDKQGNIIERKNPLGFKTAYQYNQINMVAQETDSLGKFIKYNYDGETNLTHVTRGDGTTSSVIEMQYDNKNNEKVKYVNNVLIYEKSYFKNNLLKSVKVDGETGVYTYYYDDSQRLTNFTTSDNHQLKNVYETAKDNPANGLRTSFTETVKGTAYTTNYIFDGLQRLTVIKTPSGKEFSYYYNETSQPVRLKSTSSTQAFDFDADGQLLKQSIFANSFLQLRYQYAENGNLSSYFDGTKNHTYTYDFAGRLQTWNNGTNIITYQYDKVGNLLNPNGKMYTFNGANEITAFTYDFAGNVTKDNRLNYTWDGLDQLTATSDITGSSNKVTYTYYPDGLRKTKTVGSTTYKYYYDGSDLVRVTDANQNTIWAITWNNGKVVSLTNAAGETFEYVTNYRGDVVRILDADGATVASYDYDPWGNQLSTEPTDRRINGQPIRYAGYVYDSETRLYYLQARYYDPQTARFISRDPDAGDEDDPMTMNGYTYADDNPMMMTDPDGHFAQFIPVAVAGYRLYKGYNTYKKIKGLKKVTRGPGNYNIKFSDGKKYIGKGNIKRAQQSAKERSKKHGSKVLSVGWQPAKSNKASLIKEYRSMKKHGFYNSAKANTKNPNHKLYNKISSPGRKIHYKKYGKY